MDDGPQILEEMRYYRDGEEPVDDDSKFNRARAIWHVPAETRFAKSDTEEATVKMPEEECREVGEEEEYQRLLREDFSGLKHQIAQLVKDNLPQAALRHLSIETLHSYGIEYEFDQEARNTPHSSVIFNKL
jgi:hypothetical protein